VTSDKARHRLASVWINLDHAEFNGWGILAKRRFAMKKRTLVLTMSTFILAYGPIAASAQQSPGAPPMQQPDQQHTQHHSTGPGMGPGMMGQGGMMPGMMGPGGMMGRGMMGPRDMMGPVAMRIIFALMDGDGDGTIS